MSSVVHGIPNRRLIIALNPLMISVSLLRMWLIMRAHVRKKRLEYVKQKQRIIKKISIYQYMRHRVEHIFVETLGNQPLYLSCWEGYQRGLTINPTSCIRCSLHMCGCISVSDLHRGIHVSVFTPMNHVLPLNSNWWLRAVIY